MSGQSKLAENCLLPGGISIWLACVLFAVVPLGLFLVSIETFTAGRVITDGLFSQEVWSGAEVFSPVVKAYASVSFFGYSVYVFAHVLICFAVGLYFLSRLSESRAYRANLLLCLATAALAVVAVFGITTGNTAFRGYMIDPLSAVLTMADVQLPKLVAKGGVDAFLTMALVVPTGLGIVIVLLASSSFHAALFCRRSAQGENRQDAVDAVAANLRRDLIALSIVLVSSVITSRAYFAMPAEFFLSSDNGTAKFYVELAQTLSTGTGLLFSATLVAAFAPGSVALLAISSDDSGPGEHLSSVWSGLTSNMGRVLQQFRKIWRSVVALIAPAMAAPLMDLLSTISG